MKGFCVFLAIVVCCSASALTTVDHEWEDYKAKFNKQYSPAENVRRQKIFHSNKVKIEEHNKKYEKGQVTFTAGLNQFTDMFTEEMKYLRGYKQKPVSERKGPFFEPEDGASYPASIDWRNYGYVTPVKNQGQCGSCWAFSSTGSLEGQNYAKKGKLISLSEQNLVDCVVGSGCNGGWMNDAFDYVRRNGGIDTESSYPYTARDGTCRYSPYYVGGTCAGYRNVKYNSESDLLAATATVGPISVAIDASNWSFQVYSGGVYYEPQCSSYYLDHAVLVVGYGTSNGQAYWLVKNSWGTGWGERGYIKMARNRNNNCGIANEASYPLV